MVTVARQRGRRVTVARQRGRWVTVAGQRGRWVTVREEVARLQEGRRDDGPLVTPPPPSLLSLLRFEHHPIHRKEESESENTPRVGDLVTRPAEIHSYEYGPDRDDSSDRPLLLTLLNLLQRQRQLQRREGEGEVILATLPNLFVISSSLAFSIISNELASWFSQCQTGRQNIHKGRLLWTPRAFVVISELESPKHEKILSPGKGEKYSGLEKGKQSRSTDAAAPGLIEKKRRRWRRRSTWMDVTSVFKEYYSSLPRGPVLHFTSATPHQEHHQHKEKATGASKIFIMSLSEK
jgi:hypothetical protein